MAARFILDHNDRRMDFGVPLGSSHADGGRASDPHDFEVRTRGDDGADDPDAAIGV
jgi:hypothetical protein